MRLRSDEPCWTDMNTLQLINYTNCSYHFAYSISETDLIMNIDNCPMDHKNEITIRCSNQARQQVHHTTTPNVVDLLLIASVR